MSRKFRRGMFLHITWMDYRKYCADCRNWRRRRWVKMLQSGLHTGRQFHWWHLQEPNKVKCGKFLGVSP